MKKCLFISYCTKQTPYETIAERLIKSLEKFDLPYLIEKIEDRGNWYRNTLYKAEFIRKVLSSNNHEAVVFIDCDAEVKQHPILFEKLDADLGVCYRDYERFPSSARIIGKELLSGTLYLANNKRVKALLNAWVEENLLHPSTWEQQNLDSVLSRYGKRLGLKIIELPATYCQIFDLMKNAGLPVIEHYQASRSYRLRRLR